MGVHSMKKRIISVLILSALLLSGCGGDKQSAELLSEAAETTTVIESKSAAETDLLSVTEAAETTDSETELSAEADETSETAQTLESEEKSAIRTVYAGKAWWGAALDGGIICAVSECLNFVNADTGEFIVSISIPDDLGWIDRIAKGSGDVLAKVICDDYDYSTTPSTYYANVIIVKDNYTYKTIRKCEPADVSFEACGHNIAEWDLDIVDTDSGEVIVAGYGEADDEYGFHTQWNEYCLSIDENRFVYRIVGYECLPGFGIYDFSTGTATTVPESINLVPIGCHGGKIYSVRTAWDGYGTELYITDIETLETEFFMDYPYERKINEMVEYSMPESGEFIIAGTTYHSNESGVYHSAAYKINPDTAEVETAYEIPEEYLQISNGFMADDDTYVCIGKELVLIDVK